MSCYVCVMTCMSDSGGGGGGGSTGKTTTVINLFNIIITTAIFSNMVASMHNAVMLLAQIAIAICTQNISADYVTSFTTLSNTFWHFFGSSNHIFRQTPMH